MNVLKNMEAIFIVAAALATVTTFATASVHEAAEQKAVVTTVASAEKMPVVTITAKRLTAAEKAALI